jgi:hypothetical protein
LSEEKEQTAMASSGDEEEISVAIDGFSVLSHIGFKWKVVSESELSGSFVVSNNSAQVSVS